MRVRGLCEAGSSFDKIYYYVMLETGTQAYLGRYSSMIMFDPRKNYWTWIDAATPASLGKFILI